MLELNLLPKMLFFNLVEWPEEERTLIWDNFETKWGLSRSVSLSAVVEMALHTQIMEKSSSITALELVQLILTAK